MSKEKTIERVQTGVRIEKSILKLLKAIAAHHDISLGRLVEGVMLHNFEGKCAFGLESLEFINAIKYAYNMEQTSKDSHVLKENKTSLPK